MAKTFHTPLRSSMGSFTNIVKDKHPWGLRDILREKAAMEKRENLVAKFRTPAPKNARFTLAKRMKGGKWHLSGIGEVEAKDFATVKAIARENGYNKVRSGAIVANL